MWNEEDRANLRRIADALDRAHPPKKARPPGLIAAQADPDHDEKIEQQCRDILEWIDRHHGVPTSTTQVASHFRMSQSTADARLARLARQGAIARVEGVRDHVWYRK